MSAAAETEVAIIGAGPVGLTLANILGRRGVSALVLDRQPAPYPLPRAIHFDAEAMRVFQSAGLAEAVAPTTMVGRGMLFRDRDDRVLIDWSRDQRPGPNGWYESYRFHQPDLEALLARGLDRFAHVALRRGAEATGIEQGPDGAEVALADGGRVRARFVIGCDGAESTLRGLIGAAFEDLGFEEPWLVVDTTLTRPRPDLGDYSVQFCDPDRPATYVRGVGDRRRWEMRLEARRTLEADEVWRRLARWITPADAVLERHATYTFRSRVARPWGRGRALLAGDAAHQMPPFMGQGMCAGVRDAGNLGWKLALALRGGPSLLDTYESERAPNVRQFIELSVRLGRLINQTAAGEAPRGRMASIWPALGPGWGARDDVAGHIAPQVWRDGVGSDDAAAGGVHVIAAEPVAAPVPVFTGAEGWLAERDVAAVAVRPDGYVLAAAKTAGDLAAALAPHGDLAALNAAIAHRA